MKYISAVILSEEKNLNKSTKKHANVTEKNKRVKFNKKEEKR